MKQFGPEGDPDISDDAELNLLMSRVEYAIFLVETSDLVDVYQATLLILAAEDVPSPQPSFAAKIYLKVWRELEWRMSPTT